MSDLRTFVRIFAIAAALALPGAAFAGTASFGIPGGALSGDVGATPVLGGLSLPNGSSPRLFFNFILPRDYLKDTPVRLVVYFHSPATNCTLFLATDTVAHRRPGFAADFTSSVLVPQGGSSVINASSAVTIPFQKTYVLSPGGTLAHIKRGDQFLIGLVRGTSDPRDTCNDQVIVEAIDVRYTTL